MTVANKSDLRWWRQIAACACVIIFLAVAAKSVMQASKGDKGSVIHQGSESISSSPVRNAAAPPQRLSFSPVPVFDDPKMQQTETLQGADSRRSGRDSFLPDNVNPPPAP